jgi:rhodanese-related sulfurtransferase
MPKAIVTKNVLESPVSGSCQLAGCASLALHSKITFYLPCGATLKRFKLKFLIDNWMLISVALASGGMLLWPLIADSASAGKLSPTAAVQLINREKAVVIDVGEPHEFAAGHVGGSKNIPFGQLEEKLPGLVKNKALPVILVCPLGARAGRAVAVAKKMGYEQAQSLGGGLKSWREANLPVEKA